MLQISIKTGAIVKLYGENEYDTHEQYFRSGRMAKKFIKSNKFALFIDGKFKPIIIKDLRLNMFLETEPLIKW